MKQNRFKKLTALILGVVMLLSTIPVTALGSTGDVDRVTGLTYLGDTTLYEGSDQIAVYDENGQLSWGPYNFLMASEYDITYVRIGEDTPRTERLSGYDIYYMTEGGFQITGAHNGNVPWKAGETYHATVTAVGYECPITLNIQEHPIQSVAYEGSEPIVLVKGEDGGSMSDGSWYYSIDNRDDIKFSVGLDRDGSTSFTGSVREIGEKTNAYLQFYYDYHQEDASQITKAWVGRDGLACPVDVKIYTNGRSFTSITPVSSDPVELEELLGGYYTYDALSERTEEWTEYFVFALRRAGQMPQFTVTLSEIGMEKYGMDTSSFTGTIEEIEDRFDIVIREESTQATPDMPDGETWTANDGQQHTIKLVLPGDTSCDVPVTIVPYVDTSLFSGVSLKDPDEVFVLREGADAQYCKDGKFMYDPLRNNNPTFVVTLTDYGKTTLGESRDTLEMTKEDIYNRGGYFILDDEGEEAVLNYQVGESYDYVAYLNGTLPCTFHVKVEAETQVKSVSCLPDSVQLIEGYDFDRDYGCSAEQALWDGRVQLRVELNDGNSFTGTYYEIWDRLGFAPIVEWSSYLAPEDCIVGTTHQFVFYLGTKSCTLNGILTAGTEVKLNEENFPDEAFRQYLTDCYDGFDGKGAIVAEAVRSIECCGMGIKSLSGIEKFPMLTTLYCYENQLTELDVSKNTALRFLNCDDNQLTVLNVRNNTALEELHCYNNQLAVLDVSNNTALGVLSCGNNQLTTLNVSNNTALKELYCYSNQLTALDISNNTALAGLYCYDNQLAALDVSSNTALQDLVCAENQLTVLDISNNTALQTLYCYSNQLNALDVSNNIELQSLSCGGNPLTKLDVSNNTALQFLSCGNNRLTELDVSSNAGLTSLYCSCNSLSSLDVSMCQELEELECVANTEPLKLNVANLENLNLTTVGTPKLTLTVMGKPAPGATISGSVQSFAFNALELTLTNVSDKTVFATYAIGNEPADGTGRYRFDVVPDGTYTLMAKSWHDDDAVPYTCTVTVANGVASGLPDSFLLARRGDVTLDGIVDVYDLQRLYDHVNGLKELAGYALAVADVNNDSNMTIVDVQRLYDILIGNIGNYGIASSKTG